MKSNRVARHLQRLFVLLLSAVCLSGFDLSPEHRKIDPLLLAADHPAVVAAQRKTAEAEARPDLSVPVFIHLSTDDPELPRKLLSLRGRASRVGPRLFAGRIPRDAARYLSHWPEVVYVESAKRVRPMLDVSGAAVSANVVRDGTGLPAPVNATGITGAEVYVGIVDTGLSEAHSDFHADGLGFPSRVAHWYPDPFTASVDADGHGTHVAGIAAGNGLASAGRFTGMAPAAGILAGRTTFFTTDVIAAVQDLVAFAEANFKPVAVNLSLGTSLGPHDGTSGFEAGVDFLAKGAPGSRRLIAVAAGNEQSANEHWRATFPPFGSIPMTVTFFPNVPSARLEIWGGQRIADGGDAYAVTVTSGAEVVTVPPGGVGNSASISVSNRAPASTDNTTFISIFIVPPFGGGSATIRLTRTLNAGSGRVDAYIDRFEGAFMSAAPTGTITEPANAPAALAVGSFNTKDGITGVAVLQGISFFSSLGPTRDGRIKPDITAPGAAVDSAKSAQSLRLPLLANGNYTRLQGTSMATPHVTGIAALVWQADNTLTGDQMRERLKKTASPPTDGSIAPNRIWGFGKANALAAVRNSVASITAPASATPNSPVFLGSENSSGAFGQPLSYAWRLDGKPAGSLVTLASAAPSASFTPDVPGDYSVRLDVSQATPAATPPGTATAVVRVNSRPSVTSIILPATTGALAPATIRGTGFDPDGQPLTFRWTLVSRPAGSAARSALPFFVAAGDTVTLTPDVAGNYEVGLRVFDGLDTSTQVIRVFTAGSAPLVFQFASSAVEETGGDAAGQAAAGKAGGEAVGGGGCGVAAGTSPPGDSAPAATLAILCSPIAALAARRFVLRRLGRRAGGAGTPRRHR